MRRIRARVAVLVVVLALGACKGARSTSFPFPTAVREAGAPAPQPEPPPPPVLVPREKWNVWSAYAGHTGPEACIAPFDGEPRPPVEGVLEIYHLDGAIHFVTEHNHYVGTDSTDAFYAVENAYVSGSWTCAGGRIPFQTDGHVSGRFLEGGRALTGEEVATTRLASGEIITRRWTFSGNRQLNVAPAAAR